jgi:hypothetical protein
VTTLSEGLELSMVAITFRCGGLPRTRIMRLPPIMSSFGVGLELAKDAVMISCGAPPRTRIRRLQRTHVCLPRSRLLALILMAQQQNTNADLAIP